ncbi:MAG: Spx/MgsR family RNA polymerase-binding regulatory protein [Gammaproteobacteria bacterium]|nr:Spx/MgsR family RNA polymerase-binding regulatory protein [Gammaproteobacteria bacterium]NNL49555.1 Spx/MgsR family RNA polymerase-binding regulatory protein [Woeseiaceae bacterium]
MLTIYGIRSCDACSKARKYLAEQNIEFRFHDVRDDGLDMQMLERWADRIDWERLLNRRSLSWRKIPEVDRHDMDRERALELIVDRPTLLKRPLIESEKFLAAGFSEEGFADLWASNQ